MKKIYLMMAYLSVATMAYADTSSYSIQVLTSWQYEDAVHAYTKLKKHENVRLERINDAYVIRIGDYQTKDKGLSLLEQLRKEYAGAYLKKCVIDKKRIMQTNNPYHHKDVKRTPSLPADPPRSNHGEMPPQPTVHASVAAVVKAPEIPLAAPLPEAPAINAEDYLKAGLQQHYERKYDDAIRSLSHYLSLSPKSQQRAAAMLIIGKSLEETTGPRSALGIYSRVIEGFPDTPEALLSIIAMADIGLASPALKYPIGMKGAKYARDPVTGYDTALAKKVPTPILEHVHYQKGRVLWKSGRHRESYEAQNDFLREFPNSAYRKDTIGMLKSSTITLIDQYHRSGDHISAASLFFQGRKRGLIGAEDVDAMLKSAFSLAHLGLHDISVNVIAALRKNAPVRRAADIEKALVDIQAISVSGTGHEQPADAKWDTLKSGQEYLRANNLPMAEQTLANLKNTGGDAFWSKVSEYALEDNRWTQKYQVHRRNK